MIEQDLFNFLSAMYVFFFLVSLVVFVYVQHFVQHQIVKPIENLRNQMRKKKQNESSKSDSNLAGKPTYVS